MKKKFAALTLFVSILALAFSTAALAADYPKVRLRLSTTVGEQSNATNVGRLFAQRVKEESGGNIDITVYASDQLSGGNMSKGVEMLTQGTIHCAFEPVDVMAVLDKRLLALSLPWTFKSYEEAEACLNSKGGEFVRDALRPKGLEVIGFIHNGFRQLTNSVKTITTPADIKDMKLRVPGGDVFTEFFRALGADPVSMSFSELFTALQQGTVDGQENGFDLITANNFYEVQKYITVWNYSYGSFAMVFSKKTWDTFNDDTKAMLERVAKEVCAQGCKNVVENEATKKQQVIDYGCTVTDLDAAQIQVFKDAVQDYYKKMKEGYGKEACEAFGISF